MQIIFVSQGAYKMDSTNYQILKWLNKNARMNASDIASRVNLSVSTVIERIKKMERDGIIRKYSVELNPGKLNKDVLAIMLISIEHPKYNKPFISAISNNNSITECMYLAGDSDYMIKIVTDNTKSLESTLNYIKSIEGVSKTRTNIVLSMPKNDSSVIICNSEKLFD